MRALARGEQFLAAEDLILDPDAQKRFLADGRDDRQGIVVNRGADELRRDIEDGDAKAVGLELAIGETLFAQELRAGDFEPREIVGMIDDAHHVGLGVADRDLRARLDHASAAVSNSASADCFQWVRLAHSRPADPSC